MFDKNKVKLGIAPIAWTNDDLPDLGAENTFEQCVSEMALAGFTGSEVGNKYPKDPAELKKASGTKVYALAEEKKVCRTPELNLSAQMPPVVTIEADEWLTDGQTVETAGISFQVIATPGHTVGGCCYYCKEGGFLFSGDTLFEESVGRTDFPTGSMSSLVRSVKEKLFVLPEDTKVYPGHGDITTIGREKQYNPYCQ